MKILKCYIENFGTLHGLKCELKDGLNSLNAKNGWGKSTFAAFIRAMLYGFDATDAGERERSRFYPWQGGRYGGYMVFEVRGREFRIERYFGQTEQGDVTSFSTEEGRQSLNDVVEGSLGESFFGIDSEGYIGSAYISQDGIGISNSASIESRLARLLDSGGEEARYQSALGIIGSTRDQIVRECGEDLGRIRSDIDSFKDKLEKLRERDSKMAQKQAELKSASEAREEAKRALDEVKAPDAPDKKYGPLLAFGILLIIFGSLALAVGILSFSSLENFAKESIACMAVGAILAAVGVRLIVKRAGLLKTNAAAKQAAEGSRQERGRLFDEAKAREDDLKSQLEQLTRESGSVKETEYKIESLEKKFTDYQKQLSVLDKTAVMLRQAWKNVSGEQLGELRGAFEKYLELIGMDRRDVRLGGGFEIFIREKGLERELDYMSPGVRDSVNLCLRFALLDILFKDEKPCVVLDDVLCNLDDDAFETVMGFITTLSKDYQIVYLTCNSSRMPISAG